MGGRSWWRIFQKTASRHRPNRNCIAAIGSGFGFQDWSPGKHRSCGRALIGSDASSGSLFTRPFWKWSWDACGAPAPCIPKAKGTRLHFRRERLARADYCDDFGGDMIAHDRAERFEIRGPRSDMRGRGARSSCPGVRAYRLRLEAWHVDGHAMRLGYGLCYVPRFAAKAWRMDGRLTQTATVARFDLDLASGSFCRDFGDRQLPYLSGRNDRRRQGAPCGCGRQQPRGDRSDRQSGRQSFPIRNPLSLPRSPDRSARVIPPSRSRRLWRQAARTASSRQGYADLRKLGCVHEAQ